MKSSNNKQEKTKSKELKANDNNYLGWFAVLKRPFGNRKSADKSKDIAKSFVEKEINASNSTLLDDTHYGCERLNIDEFSYSNEFLDSFSGRQNQFIKADNVKSKVQNYNTPQIVQNRSNKYRALLNNLCLHISENPKMVENILLLVVEDYISSTCEKLLQDKMRAVYRKLQNWTKNPITKPGFKRVDSVHSSNGGNITQPEEYHITRPCHNANRNTNHQTEKNERKKKLTNGIKKVTENIQVSYDLNNHVTEKIRQLNLNRTNMRSKNLIESTKNVCNSSRKNAELKEYSRPMSTIDQKDSSQLSSSSQTIIRPIYNVESKAKILPVKCDKQSKKKTNRSKSSNSVSLRSTVDNATLVDIRNEHRDASVQNNLSISQPITIDIEPSTEKFNLTLTNASSPIMFKKSTLDNVPSTHFNKGFKGLNSYVERLYKPKARRSVTFLEPRKSIINSPLRKHAGFMSQLEISSTKFSSEPNSISAQSEETGCFASKTPTPTLNSTRDPNDNISISRFSTIQVEQNDSDEQLPRRNVYMYVNNRIFADKQDNANLRKSVSPAIVSLDSTPTLVEDNRSCTNYLNFNSNKSNFFKKNSDLSSDNYVNCESESNINLSTATNTTVKAINSELSKNYSVIEIINRPSSSRQKNDDLSYNDGFIHRKNRDISNASFSTHIESLCTSSKTSLNDEVDEGDYIEEMVTKVHNNNTQESDESSKFHEIVLTDNNDCLDQFNTFMKQKSKLLSQVKTANFCSSNIMENYNQSVNPIAKVTPSSFVSVTKTRSCNDSTETNSSVKTRKKKLHSNFLKFAVETPKQEPLTTTVYKHTVSSQQKVRDKVRIRPAVDKHPMKFAKSIGKF